MKYLFRGGTVVSGRGTRRADILVEGEKILEVGRNITRKADQIIDVTGMLLMPGFIDAHTHFDLDVCNTTTADDFTTGSRAALKGGTTTVIDFACPNKGESLQYGLDLWHKKADGRTFCDYGFHMTIDDWNESIRAELPEMIRQGVTSFKMYMTYPAMMVGDRDMYWALKELRHLGGICGVHCENAGVIDGMIAEKKAAGLLGPSSHPESRPPYLEAERMYAPSFALRDHVRLHDCLCAPAARDSHIVLSYNSHPDILDLFAPDFYIVGFDRPNPMARQEDSRYHELLMTNFDPSPMLNRQLSLLDNPGLVSSDRPELRILSAPTGRLPRVWDWPQD